MENKDTLDLWVREVHKNAALSFKIEKTLFSGESRFQKVDVLKTVFHGALLLNNGRMMLCEKDEFIYHEMIAHVPLFVHPLPRRVLVIGGGDGGTVREVLRHKNVERVVMVEIDELVVNACREHIPSVSCAPDDPRLELRIEDGVRYVSDTKEIFDVALIDSTDPVGPAEPLFNQSFYKKVASLLGPGGIMVSQSESPFYDYEIQKSMLMNQRPFFKKLHLYLFPMLTYPGGLWSFAYGSQGLCPLGDFDPGPVEQSGMKMRYYNPGIHRAAFMLPTFVTEYLGHILDPVLIPFPADSETKK